MNDDAIRRAGTSDGVVIVVAAAIRAAHERGKTLDDAAREVLRRHPGACHAVHEIIGSWPASDPELLSLQKAMGLYK